MKKELITSTSVFKKYFLVWLLLMGISGYINAQTLNIDGPCPNDPFTLAEQEVGTPISTAGTWAIPLIGAVGGGGGGITMSITSIDVTSPFSLNRCSVSGTPCTGSQTFEGITFSITGGGTNFEITGTPDPAAVGWTYSVEITAATATKSCTRRYNLSIVASGSHNGEPHVTTVDGVRYDFQSIGEFVLLRGNSSKDFEIQTRQIPYVTQSPGDFSNTGLSLCVSVNTAIAARVGNHRVTYQPNINGRPDPEGMQLRVDGTLTKLGENGLDLGSGGRIVKLSAGNGIEIDFPNGTTLVVIATWDSNRSLWFLHVNVYRTIATKGIMGVVGDSSWLPKLPDGTSLGFKPTGLHERFLQLCQTFADAWRITDATSLFDYAPGTSTATFTNKAWPAENAQSCSLTGQTPQTPISLQVAQQLCHEIVDPNLRAEAIFDVMLTGDSSFVEGYLHTQRVKTGTTKTVVKTSKDSTKYGEQVTLTATVYRKFSAQNDALAGSVEFTADGEKIGQAKLEANGIAILTTTSLKAGRHQIAAKFIPDAGSTAFSSSSPDVTHTVIGGTAMWQQWWFWALLVLLLIILVFIFRKKKP